MKIGLVGYQGSGKSTVFEWMTGQKPDPALGHTAQSAMAVDPRAAGRGALPDLQAEEGDDGFPGTGRHAGPQPQPRGQRRPAGDDPRGRLPGAGDRRLRPHRSQGRPGDLRRRPDPGRHGDRLQPHHAGRGVAAQAAAQAGARDLRARARHAEDRAGGPGTRQAAPRKRHDRRPAPGHPFLPPLRREAAGGDLQHGRRRDQARAVHVARARRRRPCWPCPPGWNWNWPR